MEDQLACSFILETNMIECKVSGGGRNLERRSVRIVFEWQLGILVEGCGGEMVSIYAVGKGLVGFSNINRTVLSILELLIRMEDLQSAWMVIG